MNIPKKTEYLIGEVRKESIKQIGDATKESQSDLKELKDYINTLHIEI